MPSASGVQRSFDWSVTPANPNLRGDINVNLIEQLQTDVARHQRQLEERLAELKAEMVETRKVLTSVAKYRARLGKQHPNGEAALPLVPPDDEEEEATDEADDIEAEVDPNTGLPIPGEQSPGYETPPEVPAESEKPIRRRKAKATASEEVAGG
jgi:hypothetical protein